MSEDHNLFTHKHAAELNMTNMVFACKSMFKVADTFLLMIQTVIVVVLVIGCAKILIILEHQHAAKITEYSTKT